MHIETPLLRFFTYFYLVLGAQVSRPGLFPLRVSCLLRLAWRLAVTTFLVYGLYTLDCLKLQSIVQTCTSPSKQPLFYSFVLTGSKFTYPALFFFKFVYFTVYGHSLVLLLDAPCFRQVYGRTSFQRRRTPVIFVTYVIVPHLFFVWALSGRFSHQNYQITTSKLLEYFCLYMVFNYLYWMQIVMHYCQNGLFQQLVAVKRKLLLVKENKTPNSSWSKQFELENEAIEEIKNHALISQKLNCILNAPLLATIVLNIFNIILVFSLALICKPYLRPIVHMLFAYTYTKYLIWCNERVRTIVNQLMTILQGKNDRYEKLIVKFLKEKSKCCSKDQVKSWKKLRNLVQSRRICLFEMHLYKKFFAVKVFQIFCLDFHFVLHGGLFIISLVVFFCQTIIL